MRYNTQTLDGAVDACSKAIAANPNRADAYFVEGTLLFSATKTNKDDSLTVAPGTVVQCQPWFYRRLVAYRFFWLSEGA